MNYLRLACLLILLTGCVWPAERSPELDKLLDLLVVHKDKAKVDGFVVDVYDNYNILCLIGGNETDPDVLARWTCFLKRPAAFISPEDVDEFKIAIRESLKGFFTKSGLATVDAAIDSAYHSDGKLGETRNGLWKSNSELKYQAYLSVTKHKSPCCTVVIKWTDGDSAPAKQFKAAVAELDKAIDDEENKARKAALQKAQARADEIEAQKQALEEARKNRAAEEAEEQRKANALAVEKAKAVAAAPVYHLANGQKIRALKVQEVKDAGIVRLWDESGEQHTVMSSDIVQVQKP